jgi:hypothetical protein
MMQLRRDPLPSKMTELNLYEFFTSLSGYQYSRFIPGERAKAAVATEETQ